MLTSLFLVNCATSNFSNIKKDLSKDRSKFSRTRHIAFSYNGDSYFFRQDTYKQNKKRCFLDMGYKNGSLSYAIPYKAFSFLRAES